MSMRLISSDVTCSDSDDRLWSSPPSSYWLPWLRLAACRTSALVVGAKFWVNNAWKSKVRRMLNIAYHSIIVKLWASVWVSASVVKGIGFIHVFLLPLEPIIWHYGREQFGFYITIQLTIVTVKMPISLS